MLTRDQLLNKEILLARKCQFSIALTTGEGHTDGANVLMEVYLKGRLDPETELSVNLSAVDKVLKEYTALVDHGHVSKDLRPNFAGLASTYSNDKVFLLELAWELLRPKLSFPCAELFRLDLQFGGFERLSKHVD